MLMLVFTTAILGATADDVLVYKDPTNPEWMWGSEVTEIDGRYLLLSIRRDTSRVRIIPDALRGFPGSHGSHCVPYYRKICYG